MLNHKLVAWGAVVLELRNRGVVFRDFHDLERGGHIWQAEVVALLDRQVPADDQGGQQPAPQGRIGVDLALDETDQHGRPLGVPEHHEASALGLLGQEGLEPAQQRASTLFSK